MVVSTSSVTAAQEDIQHPIIKNTFEKYEKQTKMAGIRKARNQLNQIYWRIQARNMRNNPSLANNHAWIRREQYEESIEKVIGKAIGDRITGENEFEGRSRRDVITFDESTFPETYTQENWNAVVLYNFVNTTYCDYEIEDEEEDDETWEQNTEELLNNLQETIFAQYSAYFVKKGLENQLAKLKADINEAISDIKQYITALK